jgi:hypothetical protein
MHLKDFRLSVMKKIILEDDIYSLYIIHSFPSQKGKKRQEEASLQKQSLENSFKIKKRKYLMKLLQFS